MEYWENKVAIVTGASSGIGADAIVALAEAGMIVFGLARRKEKIEDIIAANANVKGKIFAIECDVGKTESIVSAFNLIKAQFEKVHVLINNAGGFKMGKMLDEDLSHEAIRNTMDVNVSGMVSCTKEAFKMMKNHQDFAYIINVNSMGGHLSAQPRWSMLNVYTASKHAVTNLTEHLRLEMAHSEHSKRIRVTVGYFILFFCIADLY